MATIQSLQLTYREAKSVFSSPALSRLNNVYPTRFYGRVPLVIKVSSDHEDAQKGLYSGHEYTARVDKQGNVAAVFDDGSILNLKPDEFEVVLWHEQ